MRYLTVLLILGIAVIVPSTTQAAAASLDAARFFYHDGGQVRSARIVRHYWGAKLHALATIDPRIDPKLCRAATIAEERASARSKMLCWRYVKQALLAAGAVKSYPKTNYAMDAGEELMRNYGFTRLSIRDPYSAPVGAVIVYRYGLRGHVEIRTRDGFVSDYHSKNRCVSPVIAVYGKFSS